MSNDWYYADGDQQRGPYTDEEMLDLLSTGRVALTQLVWRQGMAQWAPLNAVGELIGIAPAAATAVLPYPSPPQINYYNPIGGTIAYAGFWLRFVAYVIDAIIMWIPNQVVRFALQFAMMEPLRARSSNPVDLLPIAMFGLTVQICVDWLYFALMESSASQATLGKWAVGIIVTDMEGQRISFGRATGRYFGKILSSLILCIGFMMAGWTQKKQALHDELANTLVIRKRLPTGAL